MKYYFILYSVLPPEKIKQILFEPLGNTGKMSSEGYPVYGKIPKYWLYYFEYQVKQHEKGSEIKVTAEFRKELQMIGNIFLIYCAAVLLLCTGYYMNIVSYSIIIYIIDILSAVFPAESPEKSTAPQSEKNNRTFFT